MKKSSLYVTLPTLVLAGLLLSGCGMFRSTKAWETAKQETPLEIPPGMDVPPSNDALVIPPPGSEAPKAAAAASQVADGFVVNGTVDATYQKIGQAIESGGIGTLSSHDDAAHSYTVSVVGGAAPVAKKGFFGRLFGSDKSKSTDLGGATHPVAITVAPSGDSGSEVRAQGNAGAVAKVIDALKGRLGG